MVSETASKPRITLGLPMSKSNPELGRGKWIEKEVQDFLYSGGENPFDKDYPLQFSLGVGVMKDVFESNLSVQTRMVIF